MLKTDPYVDFTQYLGSFWNWVVEKIWELLKKKVREIYKCCKQTTIEKSSVTLQCVD